MIVWKFAILNIEIVIISDNQQVII